jgi:hypothetical protein
MLKLLENIPEYTKVNKIKSKLILIFKVLNKKYTVTKQHFNKKNIPEYTKIYLPKLYRHNLPKYTKINQKKIPTWYILGLNFQYFSIRDTTWVD